MQTKLLTFIVYVLLTNLGFSQNRLVDNNQIGWYNTFVTANVNNTFSFHGEFQFRRDNLITDNLQNLYRLGLNYKPKNELLLRAGYAHLTTFNYGDYPLNAFGKTFPEHRTFIMVQLNNKFAGLDITHRYKLEQRWIGTFSNNQLNQNDGWLYTNRLRYLLRVQKPIHLSMAKTQTKLYAAAYNEIFIGFGNNVQQNVFDQNRLAIMLGYAFNKHIRIEGGYFNHTLQLARRIKQQNVFQYNQGVIVNTYINF